MLRSLFRIAASLCFVLAPATRAQMADGTSPAPAGSGSSNTIIESTIFCTYQYQSGGPADGVTGGSFQGQNTTGGCYDFAAHGLRNRGIYQFTVTCDFQCTRANVKLSSGACVDDSSGSLQYVGGCPATQPASPYTASYTVPVTSCSEANGTVSVGGQNVAIATWCNDGSANGAGLSNPCNSGGRPALQATVTAPPVTDQGQCIDPQTTCAWASGSQHTIRYPGGPGAVGPGGLMCQNGITFCYGETPPCSVTCPDGSSQNVLNWGTIACPANADGTCPSLVACACEETTSIRPPSAAAPAANGNSAPQSGMGTMSTNPGP